MHRELRIQNILLRFLAFTVCIFALTAALPFFIHHGDVTIFSENGPVEWVQFVLLAMTTLLFLVRSDTGYYPRICLMCAFLAAFAATREMDSNLDRIIPLGGWIIPAVLLLAVGFLVAWRSRSTIAEEMATFVGTRVFSLLWAGFVMAIPFAQLVGHGDFLQEVMGDDYDRQYKRVIEELGEMLGYIILLVGAIEAFFENYDVGGAVEAPSFCRPDAKTGIQKRHGRPAEDARSESV